MFRVVPPFDLKKLEVIFKNVSRGSLQKKGIDGVIPCILEPQGDEKALQRNWPRLIQKIYEVAPLICPKCKGAMRVISSRRPVGHPGYP